MQASKRWVVFLLLLLPAMSAFAGSLEITGAWARATVPGAENGAVYGRFHNASNEAVVIVALSTSVAARADMHLTVMDGDMVKMQHQHDLTIAPGQTVDFAPGSLHIMLMGLSTALVPGNTFDISVELADGSRSVATVMVGTIGQMVAP